MIEQLIIDMMKENYIISVCSFEDCRKVKLYDFWFNVPYNKDYKNYSHGVCPDCKQKHYDNKNVQ